MFFSYTEYYDFDQSQILVGSEQAKFNPGYSAFSCPTLANYKSSYTLYLASICSKLDRPGIRILAFHLPDVGTLGKLVIFSESQFIDPQNGNSYLKSLLWELNKIIYLKDPAYTYLLNKWLSATLE